MTCGGGSLADAPVSFPTVMVSTVFFDAGETLLHAEPTFAHLFARTLRAAGHDVTDAALEERMHVIADRFSAAAAKGDRWTTTVLDSRRFWFETYAAVLEGLAIEPTDELAESLYATFTDTGNYVAFPDVLPTLEALVQYLQDQHLIAHKPKVDELFLPVGVKH